MDEDAFSSPADSIMEGDDRLSDIYSVSEGDGGSSDTHSFDGGAGVGHASPGEYGVIGAEVMLYDCSVSHADRFRFSQAPWP